jgi:hypothetical protein
MNQDRRGRRVVNAFDERFHLNAIDWAFVFLAAWISISPGWDKLLRQMSVYVCAHLQLARNGLSFCAGVEIAGVWPPDCNAVSPGRSARAKFARHAWQAKLSLTLFGAHAPAQTGAPLPDSAVWEARNRRTSRRVSGFSARREMSARLPRRPE